MTAALTSCSAVSFTFVLSHLNSSEDAVTEPGYVAVVLQKNISRGFNPTTLFHSSFPIRRREKSSHSDSRAMENINNLRSMW